MAVVLCAAAAARGESLLPQHRAHPAVVRVIAPARASVSYGSGALVAVNQTHGLVVTNWHVVRDATRPIMVEFPDGFRSGARLLRTNRDWDLAALAIWRPHAEPIKLAAEAPRPGEVLTIAGYGPGWYRASAGRCIQYVSPGGNNPFEMVELSTGARNGDSGGPILNSRGELAGVLFGSAFGRTTGSYCGRVRWFLASVARDFQRLSPRDTMIAQRPPKQPSAAAERGQPYGAGAKDSPPAALAGRGGQAATGTRKPREEPTTRPELAELPAPPAQRPDEAEASSPSESPQPVEPAGPTRAEQIKTILAAIGILAILFHALRLVAAVQEA
jgi:hypothetical protein